ncbi:MAG: DMT family transporter [Cytophagaceae bacterium]
MFSPGIRFMIICMLLITSMQLLVKALPEIPVSETILFRSVISFVLCIIILKKKRIGLQGKNPSLLILRGVFGAASLLAFFYTIHHIPLGSAITISHLSPFVIVLLAHIFLGEKMRKVQWLFFVLSFAGVLLIKGFDSRISGFDLIVALSAAVFSGTAHFMVRAIRKDNNPWLVICYFSAICIPIVLPFAVMNWILPDLKELLVLLMIGMLSHFGQYFLTRAYSETEETSKISIIYYVGIILSIAGGYFFYNEAFSPYVWFGFVLILSGVFFSLKFK